MVLGAEPGEKGYSPVWREIDVRWNMGMTPTLLTSDTEIDAARAGGMVTTEARKLLLNAPVIASNVADPGSVKPPKVFKTFYDAHKDGMLETSETRPRPPRSTSTSPPSWGRSTPRVSPRSTSSGGARRRGS